MLTKEQSTVLRSVMGESWFIALEDTLNSREFDELGQKLEAESKKYVVLPTTLKRIFNAFYSTPLDKVQVMICGQNPYHTIGVADGLAFSCSNNKYPQPSLKNILIEIEAQVYHGEKDLLLPEYYGLQRWAEQGVFLLNSALTVREGIADSHMDMWRFFTEAVVKKLSFSRTHIVYLLWGAHAKSFEKLIDPFTNAILKCGHPMTKSYQGRDTWSNNNHFLETNSILKQYNKPEIIW